jgi:hypothetical protein
VLRISARQMDRWLEARKKRVSHRLYGRTKPGTLLKHLIPLRTDHWRVKMPGFAEVDLVSHSENSASGEFGYSLNLTDVYTGWTETRAILGKSRQVVLDALQEIQAVLNLFQPSAKLMKKVRVGSKLRRRYDLPRTPLDRLVAEPAGEAAARARCTVLVKLRQGLDPFELSRQIDRKLHAIYALAHTRLSPRVPANAHSGRVTF